MPQAFGLRHFFLDICIVGYTRKCILNHRLLKGLYMPRIAIAGSTGAVGEEIFRLLLARGTSSDSIIGLASKRTVDRGTIRLMLEAPADFDYTPGDTGGHTGQWHSYMPQLLESFDFSSVEYVFFALDDALVAEYLPRARSAACTCIDSSSYTRMHPDVPLVIPEINPHDLQGHGGIIASPNCTATVMMMGLYPLHKLYGVTRVVATSYQAVSGAGKAGVSELASQSMHSQYAGRTKPVHEPEVFPRIIHSNVIPQVGSFKFLGSTSEEEKMQTETQKIMGLPLLRVSATCVRVPVMRAHAVAVSAEFERSIDLEYAERALRTMPGVVYCPGDTYPTPLDAEGKDAVYVGRLRHDNVWKHGLSFWAVGDQLLKGAALNAVQIYETLVAHTALE
jgi:aspartate-semialdehyde dehydrogenase